MNVSSKTAPITSSAFSWLLSASEPAIKTYRVHPVQPCTREPKVRRLQLAVDRPGSHPFEAIPLHVLEPVAITEVQGRTDLAVCLLQLCDQHPRVTCAPQPKRLELLLEEEGSGRCCPIASLAGFSYGKGKASTDT
jgi:hypothetical protein